jgi:CRP-like cAMP-binding protein
VRQGEQSDEVFFILAGQAVAGIEENGNYRSLETMRVGDVFGEIAALMGTPRTVNVVAAEPMTLLQVPGEIFRNLMTNSTLSRWVHQKFLERMTRTSVGDLPRFASMDQAALKELRTESEG